MPVANNTVQPLRTPKRAASFFLIFRDMIALKRDRSKKCRNASRETEDQRNPWILYISGPIIITQRLTATLFSPILV